jgi:hypothetical protein
MSQPKEAPAFRRGEHVTRFPADGYHLLFVAHPNEWRGWHEDNADVNAARNILQARALAVEPPKRTLRRVGKRKHQEEAVNV